MKEIRTESLIIRVMAFEKDKEKEKDNERR